MSDYQQVLTSDEEPEEEEQPRRGRIRRYKPEDVMWQECEQYVMAGKRLPKLHSRWLLNRFENRGSSLHGLEIAHNYTLDQLTQAQETIKALRERIRELETRQE